MICALSADDMGTYQTSVPLKFKLTVKAKVEINPKRSGQPQVLLQKILQLDQIPTGILSMEIG